MNGKEKYSRADYRLECKIEALEILAECQKRIMMDSTMVEPMSADERGDLGARVTNMFCIGTRIIMDPKLRAPTAIVEAVKRGIRDLAEKYPNGSGPLGSIVRVWCELAGQEADRMLATARHVCAEQADRRERVNNIA